MSMMSRSMLSFTVMALAFLLGVNAQGCQTVCSPCAGPLGGGTCCTCIPTGGGGGGGGGTNPPPPTSAPIYLTDQMFDSIDHTGISSACITSNQQYYELSIQALALQVPLNDPTKSCQNSNTQVNTSYSTSTETCLIFDILSSQFQTYAQKIFSMGGDIYILNETVHTLTDAFHTPPFNVTTASLTGNTTIPATSTCTDRSSTPGQCSAGKYDIASLCAFDSSCIGYTCDSTNQYQYCQFRYAPMGQLTNVNSTFTSGIKLPTPPDNGVHLYDDDMRYNNAQAIFAANFDQCTAQDIQLIQDRLTESNCGVYPGDATLLSYKCSSILDRRTNRVPTATATPTSSGPTSSAEATGGTNPNPGNGAAPVGQPVTGLLITLLTLMFKSLTM